MDYEEIINYWFDNNKYVDSYRKLWFEVDEFNDKYIRDNFKKLLEIAENRGLEEWKSKEKSLLALIILLDQFSRNIYRGSSDMYKNDEYAVELSNEFIKKYNFFELPLTHQIFILMPYRHSENLQNQEFVLDMIQKLEKQYENSNDATKELLKKFKNASLISYKKIEKNGQFIFRYQK